MIDAWEYSRDLKEVRNLISAGSRSSAAVKDQSEYSRRLEEISKRSEDITKTLKVLTEQQVERYKFRRIMQIIISIFFMLLVLALTIAIIICIKYVLSNKNIEYVNAVTVLAGSCVTYLTSVITIVTVIVRYMFPDNEDKLLTELLSKIVDEELIFFNKDNKNKDN